MSWLIRESDLRRHAAPVLSTLFCVGNGRTTTRGTLSEQRFEAYRGVYLSGLYTRAPWGLNYYLGGPDWLVAFVRAGGAIAQPVASERQLDLREGILRRTALVSAGDVKLEVQEERFASLAQPNLMAQRFTVRIVEGTGSVQVVLGLDGEARNHRAKYYQPGQFPAIDETGLKLSSIESIHADDQSLRVVLKARASDVRAAAHATVRQAGGPALDLQYAVAGGMATAAWTAQAESLRGQSLVFEKLCALTGDSPGYEDAPRDGRRLAEQFRTTGYDRARQEHLAAMQRFWDLADVQIEGDEPSQLSVRYALWATRIAAPEDGGRSSIGAKNLTGDWYRGAVFWDMEMFQLPLLAAVAPPLARNHVLYRANRLASARTLAAQDGYEGARYPWHSYVTGLEEPPVMGGFLYQQQHVNLAVAWGILHYQAMSGDHETILERGLDVIVELCRFWCSRVTAPDGAGKVHIVGVCGPDENHPSIADNAYTNLMVTWLLRQANALLDQLARHNPPKLAAALDRLRVDDGTRARWREVADRLAVPRRTGMDLPAPFEGFEQMPEPDDHLAEQGVGSDKRFKQADLLMLFQALPMDYGDDVLAACWREYAALCDQTSSLSLCTHALLAIRLGRLRDAERFFRVTTGADLDDKMGNTGDGIHAAAQGGIWMATVQGFGGLRAGPGKLAIDPMLPPAWKSLRYQFLYHNQPIAVEVGPGHVQVANNGREPVALSLCGRPTSLLPGKPVRQECLPRWRRQDLEAVIFDLDGVLVSTDRFHYQAWKELADELGIPFDEQANHALRGVSREESLRRLYGSRPLPSAEAFKAQCDRKNARYVELVNSMTPRDVLPGALDLLRGLRAAGIRIGIASASRNAARVLQRTGLDAWTDALCDGNNISAGKPDPQVFYVAAQRLRCLPWNCLGVEDAATGIESIHRAGMAALGIGPAATGADVGVPDIAAVDVAMLQRMFHEHQSPLDPYTERSLAHIKREVTAGYAATMAFGQRKG